MHQHRARRPLSDNTCRDPCRQRELLLAEVAPAWGTPLRSTFFPRPRLWARNASAREEACRASRAHGRDACWPNLHHTVVGVSDSCRPLRADHHLGAGTELRRCRNFLEALAGTDPYLATCRQHRRGRGCKGHKDEKAVRAMMINAIERRYMVTPPKYAGRTVLLRSH